MSPAISNLGGFLIGLVVAAFLFGVCTVQVPLYFVRFPKDPLFTRVLVMFLWLLLVAQIVFMSDIFYRDICAPWLLNKPWSRAWPVLATIISGLVQAFYTYRSHRLCRSWWLTVTMNALILLKFVVGFAYIFRTDKERLNAQKKKWLGIILISNDAVVDLFIVLSMTYSLVKRRTRFASTNTIINRLVGYAVGTGLVTSLLSIVAVITFVISDYNPIFTMTSTMITCVYFFAMLANLHTRSTLKKLADHVDDVPIRLTTIELQSLPARSGNEAASGAGREGEPDRKNSLSNGDIS